VASKFSLFLAELKRRKVYHVAAVYAAVGAAISIAVPDLFGAFRFPPWAAPLVVVVIAIGFPIALVLAWAYEVRPEESGPAVGESAADQDSPDPGAPVHGDHTVPSVWSSAFQDSRPSVAVLPFANISTDPENEYFSDGITFDIINHLAKITDLKVISRTSIMRFKGTDRPLRRIGEELGVATIVEGEVQRVGDRVRVSAQLVDARTDEHLWADQYDRELLDVFTVQSDVAQRVAAALTATLTPGEKERIERIPTGNFEAYRLYLKGRHFWEQRGKGIMKGLEYFRRALEVDPDSSPWLTAEWPTATPSWGSTATSHPRKLCPKRELLPSEPWRSMRGSPKPIAPWDSSDSSTIGILPLRKGITGVPSNSIPDTLPLITGSRLIWCCWGGLTKPSTTIGGPLNWTRFPSSRTLIWGGC
jgi:TolB-like protein